MALQLSERRKWSRCATWFCAVIHGRPLDGMELPTVEAIRRHIDISNIVTAETHVVAISPSTQPRAGAVVP